MENFIVLMALISGVLLVIGLLSETIKKTPLISEPLIALGAGILLGPSILDVSDPTEWPHYQRTLEAITLGTLALGLMGVALRIPFAYLRQHWRSIGIFLGIVMPLMWMASTLLIILILDVSLEIALLIGAIITPTDPIVATSIVTGDVAEDNLPARLRHLLSAESGLNDGLAFPLVFLMIFAISTASGTGVGDWAIDIVMWETIAGGIMGVLIGMIGAWLLQRAERQDSIEKASFLTFTIALSLFTLGVVEIAGANGVFAVFVAGAGFSYVVDASERIQEANIQEAVSLLFTLPIFILVGLTIPWEGWGDLGWPGLLLAASVLLLRRMPVLLLLKRFIPAFEHRRDALFVGWFGPIGVAALFYALVVQHRLDHSVVWHVVSLIIVASIVAHGMSATTLTRLYSRDPEESP